MQTCRFKNLSFLCLLLLWSANIIGVAVAQTNLPLQRLSLIEAEQLALEHHPRITAAALSVLVSKQGVREARSAYYPTINGQITAIGTQNDRNNVLSAGSLQTSSIYNRQADGVDITQLLTDFGRTQNLVSTYKLRSKAYEQNSLATRAQILLAVNSAYFSTLQAQSVLEVAKETISTRQVIFDRVEEMAKNNLKSDLDLSFSEVTLEESKLLLANAENDLQSAFATLSNVLGDREKKQYVLQDESLAGQTSTNDWELVQTALGNRPDLRQLRYEQQAAGKFAAAERGLDYPTINAFGAAGYVPYRNDAYLEKDYAAAGVNMKIPIFDGFLFAARKSEASLRAQVAAENLRDAENNVIRDVRIAAINRDFAAKRLELTTKLRSSADKSYELAEERYQVGSSSIVEVTQAQLSQTEAKIGQARANFELQMRNAVLVYQLGLTEKPK